MPLPPDLEDGLIILGVDIIAARIADTRQTQPVELAEEFLRALHLLIKSRMRKSVEQGDRDAIAAASVDGSRRGAT